MMFMALVLVTTGILATESRFTALGNPYGYIRDDTDVFGYPGSIHRYNQTIIAELDNSSSQVDWSMGANLPLLNYKIGIYMNRATDVDIDDYLLIPSFSHSNYIGGLDISKKVEFIIGFMEKFGVGFATSMDSYKIPIYNPSTQTYKKDQTGKASYLSFFGGMSDDKMDLGVRVRLSGGSIENEESKEELTVDNFGLHASGRYYIVDNDAIALMAKASFGLDGWNVEYKPSATIKSRERTESFLMFNAGVGANFKIDENNTVIVGLTPFMLQNASYESPTYPSIPDSTYTNTENISMLYFPEYNIALESQILSWLTGRIGARQSYQSTVDEYDFHGSPVHEYYDYDKFFGMNLGLAFNFGKFTVDTVIVKELLFDGPNFIGGKSNGIASKVSVTYEY